MKISDRIKSEVLDQALSSGDPAKIEQAAKMWQYAADAEKSEVDAESASRVAGTERIRFWIPVVGSLVSTFALVGTLIFQIHQLTVNSRLQIESNEATELRDLLQTAAFPPELSAMASQSRLKSMLSLAEAPREARDLAIVFLSATGEPVLFGFLFKEVARTTNEENFPDLLRLSYMLDTQYYRANDRLKALKSAPPPGPSAPPSVHQYPTVPFPSPSLRGRQNAGISLMQMSPEELQKTLDSLNAEITEVGDAIADFLRKSPQNKLDMTGVAFYFNDLSDVDFGAANLTSADMEYSDIKGADLTRVTAFDGGNWSGTDWWRATRINSRLLNFLITNFPYTSGTNYYQDSTSPTEYAQEVSRLGGILPSPTSAPSSVPTSSP